MKDKLVKEDIGLIDEIIELLKQLGSMEAHALASYRSTKEQYWLNVKDETRKIRTRWLSMIVKKDNGQGWCFLPKTKIITSRGMVDIEDIKVGDKVLTHKNRFMDVLETYQREIKEEVVEIKTNYTNLNLNVTKNHLFYVASGLRSPQKDCWKKDFKKPKFVWKIAEELSREDFLYLPRYNIINDIDKILVEYRAPHKTQYGECSVDFYDSAELKVDSSLMRLIGLYLSEGNHNEFLEKKHGWKSGGVAFTFSLKEEDFAKQVVESLHNRFGSIVSPSIRDSTIQVYSSKRVVREFFSQFGSHAHNKVIPQWVIDLPKEKLSFLLRGLFEGDGSTDKFQFKYATVSREMAFAMRLILNKCGILCNLSNRGRQKDSIINGRKIISRHDVYHLAISGDSARRFSELTGFPYSGGKKTSGQFGHVGKEYFLIPILGIKKERYMGKVYNFAVNEDESYATFNGVAHNCFSKHSHEALMRVEEIATRFLSTRQLSEIEKCDEDYDTIFKNLFLVNGLFDKIKFETKSGA